MSRSTRFALLAALLAVFAVTAVVAGLQTAPPPPPSGTERLGPEPGEPVAEYLDRAAASLPPAGSGDEAPRWALVQLAAPLAAPDAAALVREVRLGAVVLRVPVPGVQTALTTRDLPGQQPERELVSALDWAAGERARAAQAAPPDSRAAAVAGVEASRLRDRCACVLALLVRGAPGDLAALAAAPGVRAVHAAHPDAARTEVAVAPLLPEQTAVAGPVPDDAPVPPR